jgi:SNF2 family DNA or RNA helicase
MTPRIINDHIVLPVQGTGQLRALFPGLKETQIGEQTFAAVPFTLEAARIFNNLGVKVPSPIRTQYEWPGRYTPRWYQHDTAEFFTLNSRCYCLSEMRTGKTLAALWAADYLRQTGKIKRTLSVAPLSTLWDVWETNIFESFPLRTFCVLHGSRKKRLELLAQPHDFYIVNHHGVQLIEAELKNRPDIDLIILDEQATFRSAKAKTLWTPLNAVLNKHGIVRSVWGLTGTPTPNAPTDAFGQCKLITPENYRGHFTSFKNETMMQLGQFKWVPRKGSAESVARVLRPSIRFERSVCTDMPTCYIDRRATLSEEQAKAYKQLIQLAKTEVRGSTVTAVNAAVLLSKLCQTAAGAVYGASGEVIKMDFGPRLAVLEELIEENTEKVIVLVPFTGALEALAEKLRKRWSVAIVNGDVSAGKRTQIFRDFRTGKDPHILLAHPGVLAHGLDLTAASLIIWYAPTTSHDTYCQANARIDGSKQAVKIDIAHIYATAEERRIYSVLKEKGRLQDVVLELSMRGSA